MPDTRTFTNRVLSWKTDSDDFSATVEDPDGASKSIKSSEPLPTTDVGVYELHVADRQNRKLTVTIDGDATPKKVSRTKKQRVRMTYQVDP